MQNEKQFKVKNNKDMKRYYLLFSKDVYEFGELAEMSVQELYDLASMLEMVDGENSIFDEGGFVDAWNNDFIDVNESYLFIVEVEV